MVQWYNRLDVLDFIQMRVFTDAWERLGLTDDDLRVLELAIMARPKGNPVIPGTGGLRKLRFAPVSWRKGKRGGLRVCYVYFDSFAIALLVLIYSKREADDLSSRGRLAVKKLIDQQRKELSMRRIR
jgi:hypothetical protein